MISHACDDCGIGSCEVGGYPIPEIEAKLGGRPFATLSVDRLARSCIFDYL